MLSNMSLERVESAGVKSGKQGSIYVMQTVKRPHKKYVLKLSRDHDYLIQHEAMVGKALDDLAEICPNFARCYGTTTIKLSELELNDIRHRYMDLPQDALLLEYIPRSHKLFSYICSSRIHENIIFSLIKQVLLATCLAQIHKGFTHYDLHSRNVLVSECDPDTVLQYHVNGRIYSVPTYGCIAKIIDYGFAYVDDMIDQPMYSSLCFTDVGFMCDRFDPVTDAKLFLTTVSSEMIECRDTRKVRYFRNLSKSLFQKLKIDDECGWDKDHKPSAIEYVIDSIDDSKYKSHIFSKYIHQCLDILNTLIVVPMKPQDSDNITDDYASFMDEWMKIENQISQTKYKIFVLRKIVDGAREVREEFLNTDTQKQAEKSFKIKLWDAIDKVGKFCITKHINISKLLMSMYNLSHAIEGILYDVMEQQMHTKLEGYNKLNTPTLESIIQYLDQTLPDTTYQNTVNSKFIEINFDKQLKSQL